MAESGLRPREIDQHVELFAGALQAGRHRNADRWQPGEFAGIHPQVRALRMLQRSRQNEAGGLLARGDQALAHPAGSAGYPNT